MTDEKRALIELGQIIGQCATKLTAHDIVITDLMRLVYERTGMTREEMMKRHDRIRHEADETKAADPLTADQVAGWIHLILDALETPIHKGPPA